jgi:hypothetical protein
VVVARVEHEPSDAQAAFPIGAWVSVRGGQGVFQVMRYARDGSLLLYGGTWGRKSAHVSYRNAYPTVLRLAAAPIREDDE